MIQFFDISLSDGFKTFVFSYPNGDPSPLVIFDDGWSPKIGVYNEHDQTVIDDVVEELDCMTNVATRDEALSLIHELHNFINYSKKAAEEQFKYLTTLYVKSQFSTKSLSYSYVTGPPDDGEVIQLSNDIMTSSPGQIKFKLRFKRKGFWVLDFLNNIKNIDLYADNYGYKGLWAGQGVLPTSVETPNPVSINIKFIATADYNVYIERLFMCLNVDYWYSLKTFYWDSSFNMTSISYSSNLHAQGNTGYLIQDTTTTNEERPYSTVNLSFGTYAVFVSWRSVQSNVSHKLQIQFDTNTETNTAVLLANDTNPKVAYLGTVTTSSTVKKLYLNVAIGHSTGFEIEKIVLIKLKKFSKIIELRNVVRPQATDMYLSNDPFFVFKSLYFYSGSTDNNFYIPTYDDLNVVADSNNFKIAFVGHSPGVFSLRNTDGRHIYQLNATIYYKNIRTTFH